MSKIDASALQAFEAAVTEFIEYTQSGQDFGIEFQARMNHGQYLLGQNRINAAIEEYRQLVKLLQKIDLLEQAWAPRALTKLQSQLVEAVKDGPKIGTQGDGEADSVSQSGPGGADPDSEPALA